MADPLDYVSNYYQQNLGLTPEQARGAARWMNRVESGLRPGAFNPGGGGQGALGIAQWRGPRQRALLDQYGPSPTLDQQLAFSVQELRGPESGALQALRSAKTEDQAYQIWGQAYERPGISRGEADLPTTKFNPQTGRDEPYVALTHPSVPDITGPMALLDHLLGNREQPEAEPEQASPLAFLDALLASGPEVAKSGQATSGQAPDEGPDLASIGQAAPPENVLAEAAPLTGPKIAGPEGLLDRLLSGINPIGSAQAAENPAAGMVADTPFRAAASPAMPQEAPSQSGSLGFLDRLLGMGDPETEGAVAASQAMAPVVGGFAKGLAQGVGLPGEELKQRLPSMSGPQQAGAALGRIPGGLFVEPIRGGAQSLDAATKGEPVSAEEMVSAAAPALTGGIAPRGSVAAGIGRGPGFAPARPPTGAVGKAINTAREEINALLSPTTVDPFSQAAESLIRQSTGQARRSTEQANAALEPYRPLVNQHVLEFDQWMRLDPATRSAAPQPGLLNFLDYVETRSGGGVYAGPPELKPLADTMRKLYREREMAIAAEPSTASASFIEDYYSHVWKDRAKARTLTVGTPPRTGSGAPLKARSIPTISEGIRRGLEPASLDPIETTMRYIANMDRFLAHNRVFRVGKDSGAIQVLPPGTQPEGWTPLEGRLATTPGGQAYAPEAFARIYNNAISSGVYADRLGGAVYNGVLMIKNSINSMVLGFPGFHMTAMAQEATASALARAVGDLAEGEILDATRRLGLDGIPVYKSVDDVLRTGRKMQRQYLGLQDYGPDWEKVANALAEGGGRIIGRGQEWRGSAMANYFTAWKRGQLKLEALAAGREIAQNPLRVPVVFAREIGRLMETIGAPVFDVMVPRLKAAAFFDEMYAWQQSNPLAGRTEQLAKARELVDVMDDRFGELILDNIFWGKRVKQTLQLITTSLGWELGTLRSGLGAGADVLRGKWSPRIRYMIGLAGAIGLYNAMYSYLVSGTGMDLSDRGGPGGVPRDLLTPRTGGKTPEGAPERILLPGYGKDALGYWHDPATEFLGKLSPAGRLATEMASGRDYFGHEIAPYPQGTPEWFKAWAGHVISGMTPIPLKQETLRGTAIGPVQRAFGGKPAPEYMQNPQRADQMEVSRRLRDLKSELAGLYAHGRRTTQTPQELEQKRRTIMRAIERTQRDFQARTRDRQRAGVR